MEAFIKSNERHTGAGWKNFFVVVLAAGMLLTLVGCKASEYNTADQLRQQERWMEAAAAYEALGDYEDSTEKAKECKYQYALNLMEMKVYDEAQEILLELGDYSEAAYYGSSIGWHRLAEYLRENDVPEREDKHSGYVMKLWYDAENEAIMLGCERNRSSSLRVRFTAALTAGSTQAALEGSSSLMLKTAVLEDRGTTAWNIARYQVGDTVKWQEYEVSGNKGDGTPLSSDPAGLCANAETPLRCMTQGLAAILEEIDLGVAMADLGFTSYE